MSKTKEVAVQQENAMTIGGEVDMEELAREAAPISGAGTSQDRADNLIPYLVILQDMSPQVKKRDPAYIDGAEAGMIMRTDIKKVYSGSDGILFQPCHFSKKFVEWVPRDAGGGAGAGFAGIHDRMPIEAKPVEDRPNKFKMPNGNDIVETRYHFGNILDPSQGRADPCVIAMSSSGHTVSRSWMALMNQFRIGGSIIAPSFFRAYKLTTVERSNAQGSWFVWKPEDMGWVSKPLRDLGNSLYQSVASGEKTADDPIDVTPEREDDVPF